MQRAVFRPPFFSGLRKFYPSTYPAFKCRGQSFRISGYQYTSLSGKQQPEYQRQTASVLGYQFFSDILTPGYLML